MDALTFISEIIKTITWPIVTILIFFKLQGPISKVIFLIDKMKYKDFELEFGRKVQELAKEAKKQLPESVKANDDKNHLYELATISPRSAILEAWLLVEDAAVKKINQRKIKLSSTEKKSPLMLLNALTKSNILDAEKQLIFNKLRNLRNASAHATELSFDEELAIDYIDSAMLLVSFLRE
jgi:hypothetical protein